jgi:hypothetical protein
MNGKTLLIAAIAIITSAAWYLRNSETLYPAAVTSRPVDSSATQAGSIKRTMPLLPPAETQPLAVAAPSSLSDSDASVKKAVADFSPQLLHWLIPENQIQKWVMLIDQIADGAVPNEYLPLSYTMVSFRAQQNGDKWILDAANYARANTLIDVVLAIPPSRIAPYYQAWYPLFDKAYRDLGRDDGFDQRLRTAINRVLAVKPLSEQPALIRPGVYYQYADARYESASEVEKLLWRLGPKNTERLQAYLRNLKSVL